VLVRLKTVKNVDLELASSFLKLGALRFISRKSPASTKNIEQILLLEEILKLPTPPLLPPPLQNGIKFKKNSSVFNTDRFSKTNRGGTLKRLLLRTTPRLKEPKKARQKSPLVISESKAYPTPFCTRACARKASPIPPSARLEIILQLKRSSYILGGAFTRRSSQFK